MHGSDDVQVLSFPFDVNRDTVDGVAEEMQEQFGLSATDRELAASAMREVISKQVRLGLHQCHIARRACLYSLVTSVLIITITGMSYMTFVYLRML